MAFKSYSITSLPDGNRQLAEPMPVRFSGRQGLVARHLSALNPPESVRWSLEDTEWLGLAAQEPAKGRWIIFEQMEDGKLNLSRVNRINGMISGGQTELLFMMSPLTLISAADGLVVSVPSGGRAWSEELALDGAPRREGAAWSWCERALHVGSAVFGTR